MAKTPFSRREPNIGPPSNEYVPSDNDRAVQDSLVETLRHVNNVVPLEDNPRHYAPPAHPDRIDVADMNGKEELQNEIISTIAKVRDLVKREIANMRRELDSLEAVADESFEAAKLALENQLNIAAQALAAGEKIKEQISGYRLTVEQSLPKSNGNGNNRNGNHGNGNGNRNRP